MTASLQQAGLLCKCICRAAYHTSSPLCSLSGIRQQAWRESHVCMQIEEPSSILPLVPMMNKIRFEVQAVMREMQHPLQYAT